MKKTSALWLSVVLAASLLFSSCAKQGGQTASPAETTGTAAETTAGTSAAETTAASGAPRKLPLLLPPKQNPEQGNPGR